jgi:predicted RNase H-like HicB family nuclease
MKYHFEIHQENDGGYWAECIELPGCVTEGDNYEELYENMQDALNTYIYEPANSTKLAALPDENIKTSADVVEVPVDPAIALGFQIRYLRLKHGYTQKEMAEKMGYYNIFSYLRLEDKSYEVALNKYSKLKKIFPEFSVDRALA